MRKVRAVRLGMTLTTALGFAIAANAGDFKWNYDDATGKGPSQWGKLDPDFVACAEGLHQSPIDLDNATKKGQAAIVLKYRATPLVIENNGHTIEVPYTPGSTLRVGPDTYELLQFHFHLPSEHTVAGQPYAMEAHLVHRNSAGQLAVVGVLLVPGEANAGIESVFSQMPLEEGEHEVEDAQINVTELLPRSLSYYTYSGSLTTPPCSEGVRWFVLKEPVSISAKQIEAFRKVSFLREFPANARPVQPINDRTLTEHPAGKK